MAGKRLLPLTVGLLSANFIAGVTSRAPGNPWERPQDYIIEWGDLYSRVGSYYNGTVNLNFGMVNNTEFETDMYPGDSCRTPDGVTLHYDGLVRISRPDPEVSGNNTIALGMVSWDRQFTLEGLDWISAGSGEETFKLNSEIRDEDDGEPPAWDIEARSAGDDGYRFNATPTSSADDARQFHILLNFTEPCTEVSGPRPSDELEYHYVYVGDILNPRNGSSDDPDITTPEITTPQITGRFDEEEATFSLVASYSMHGGSSTLLQGVLNVTFSGTLDPGFSDQLLLDQDQPDWKPTILGEQNDEDEEDGASMTVANLVLACGMMVFVIGFLTT